MIQMKDMMGNSIQLKQYPQRIISVVPSQTEFLFDLELEKEVIGITKFCVHPEIWFKNKTRIGGTKALNIEKIKSLNPDLIIANKEENIQADIIALQALFPVYLSDITTIADAFTMMHDIGTLTNKVKEADEIVQKIHIDMASMPQIFAQKKVAYFIWKNPWMVAAQGTFIHEILKQLGATNVFQHLNRYPEINETDIVATPADYILLSSEPYPFKDQHIEELQKLNPSANIQLVDGEMFSWYGSRMLALKTYITQLHQKIIC